MKLANSLIVVALMAACGCTTWERAYVAIHDAADKALAVSTNTPPVVTPLVVVAPPGVNPTPGAAACGCDLTKPPAPAYEDVRQVTIKASQWEECGLESKYGILIRPVVTFGGHILCVTSILEGAIKKVDGGYEIACPIQKLGYSWHILGYSLGDDHVGKMQKRFEKGERIFIPRDGKRAFVFVEGRQ